MKRKENAFKRFFKSRPILYATLALTALTVVVAFALSFIKQQTDPIVKARQAETLVSAVSRVIPGAADSAPLEGHTFSEPVVSALEVYDAANQPLGYAIEAAPGGFGGAIRMLVGVSPDGVATGVAILDMKETPDLGEKVKGEAFLRQFIGRESGFKMGSDPEDVQAISGATISSNAVRDGVAAAIAAVLQITGGVSE